MALMGLTFWGCPGIFCLAVFFAFVIVNLMYIGWIDKPGMSVRHRRVHPETLACTNELYWNRGLPVEKCGGLHEDYKNYKGEDYTKVNEGGATEYPGQDNHFQQKDPNDSSGASSVPYRTYLSLAHLQGMLETEDKNTVTKLEKLFNMQIGTKKNDVPKKELKESKASDKFVDCLRCTSAHRLKQYTSESVFTAQGLMEALMRTHYYCVFIQQKQEYNSGLGGAMYDYWVATTSNNIGSFTLRRVRIFERRGESSTESGTWKISNLNLDNLWTAPQIGTWAADDDTPGNLSFYGPLCVDATDLDAAYTMYKYDNTNAAKAFVEAWDPCWAPWEDAHIVADYLKMKSCKTKENGVDVTRYSNPDNTWWHFRHSNWPFPMCTICALVCVCCGLSRSCTSLLNGSPAAKFDPKNHKNTRNAALCLFGPTGQLCLASTVMCLDIMTVLDDPTSSSQKYDAQEGTGFLGGGSVGMGMFQGDVNSYVTGTAAFMMDCLAVQGALNKWAPGQDPLRGTFFNSLCCVNPKYSNAKSVEEWVNQTDGLKPNENDQELLNELRLSWPGMVLDKIATDPAADEACASLHKVENLQNIVCTQKEETKQMGGGDEDEDEDEDESAVKADAGAENVHMDKLLFQWFGRDVFISRNDCSGFWIGMGIVLFGLIMHVRNGLFLSPPGENFEPKSAMCRGDVDFGTRTNLGAKIGLGNSFCFPYTSKGCRQWWYYALVFLDLFQVAQVAIERTHRTVISKLDKSGYGVMDRGRDGQTFSVGHILAGKRGDEADRKAYEMMFLTQYLKDPSFDAKKQLKADMIGLGYMGPLPDEKDPDKIAPFHMLRRLLTIRQLNGKTDEQEILKVLLHDHTDPTQEPDVTATVNSNFTFTTDDTQNFEKFRTQAANALEAHGKPVPDYYIDAKPYDLALTERFYRHALTRIYGSHMNAVSDEHAYVGFGACCISALTAVFTLSTWKEIAVNIGGGLAAHMVDALCWQGARCDNAQFYDLPHAVEYGKAWSYGGQNFLEFGLLAACILVFTYKLTCAGGLKAIWNGCGNPLVPYTPMRCGGLFVILFSVVFGTALQSMSTLGFTSQFNFGMPCALFCCLWYIFIGTASQPVITHGDLIVFVEEQGKNWMFETSKDIPYRLECTSGEPQQGEYKIQEIQSWVGGKIVLTKGDNKLEIKNPATHMGASCCPYKYSGAPFGLNSWRCMVPCYWAGMPICHLPTSLLLPCDPPEPMGWWGNVNRNMQSLQNLEKEFADDLKDLQASRDEKLMEEQRKQLQDRMNRAEAKAAQARAVAEAAKQQLQGEIDN